MRRLILALALMLVIGHHYANGQWWTDVYDYQWPGGYIWLYSTPGYWPSPW